MKTEINLWTDIVKKNATSTTNSVKSIRKVVKSAVDDNIRSNNFIMCGAREVDSDQFDEH